MRAEHHTSPHGEMTHQDHLASKKLSHIIKAARSATAANVLAPLLCIPVFGDQVQPGHFHAWLGYMFASIVLRTWIIYRIEHRPERIREPQRDLRRTAWAVGIVGFGWGLGWPLMTPDLDMVNRMIYVYMTTAAMISSMFAYSVDRRTFYFFTLPIMVPAVSTILWPADIFPWPFLVGVTALYFVVLTIARNFSQIFSEAIELRFGNERLYRELAQERDLSIAANVAKSKFIAAASHDLRQPLHAVNINLDLFRPPGLGERDLRLLRRIKGSIWALNGMFEALLDMSKLDSHTTHVQAQRFSLVDLTDAIREIAEPRAARKGLSFIAEPPARDVHGDKQLLQQLLLNLVMNAIQYTREGGVQLRFHEAGGLLVVEVVDSGIGISREDQASIFNEFFRAATAREEHDGLGLGLSIVRRICKLINASVQVESEVGQGTRFTVSTAFPVLGPVAQTSQEDATSAPPHGEPQDDLTGRTIAVFENDEVIIDAYRETLLAHGARVIVLPEQDQALRLQLRSIDRIDCILSDYHLAGTTGDVLVKQVREEFNLDIPAVFITGDTSPETMGQLKAVKATVLFKPLTLQRVAGTLAAAIEAERQI